MYYERGTHPGPLPRKEPEKRGWRVPQNRAAREEKKKRIQGVSAAVVAAEGDGVRQECPVEMGGAAKSGERLRAREAREVNG